MELEFKAKLGIADGQKFDKEGKMQPRDIEYSLSISIGPTSDLKQLEALKQQIVKDIKQAGGQETLD